MCRPIDKLVYTIRIHTYNVYNLILLYLILMLWPFVLFHFTLYEAKLLNYSRSHPLCPCVYTECNYVSLRVSEKTFVFNSLPATAVCSFSTLIYYCVVLLLHDSVGLCCTLYIFSFHLLFIRSCEMQI